jgi:hypothetical protein
MATAALFAGQPNAAAQPSTRAGPVARLGAPVPREAELPEYPVQAQVVLPPPGPAASGTAVRPAPDEAPCAGCAKADGGPLSAWLENPKVPVIPPAGFFPVPPTGPGYYSLLDCLTNNWREKPPPTPYARSAICPFPFFDADFRYVDKPGYDLDILEQLHRIHLGDYWLFATGGEFRYRLANEVNSRMSGTDNRYDLTRLRVFGDLWYKDVFRTYVEFISAQSFNQDLKPLIIDRNYADLLNAFVQIKLFEDSSDVPWYVRGGRQQLLFGSQRLISPLDWANTMRTFDGVRLFRHGEKVDFDVFWARPVIPNPSRFDSNDPNQNFFGAWMEYRPTKNRYLDLYWLFLDNENNYDPVTKTPVPVGQLPWAPYTVHTLGYRYAGKLESNTNILFDSENMLQMGRSSTGGSLVAGASSTGIGYNFSKVPMNPTFWAYFDYASGSRDPALGPLNTFNQLYPFGHYYFGWLDYVGRQNIQDWNFCLYLYPTKWVTFNAQYHVFFLDSATDALYNAGGAVLFQDPTGKAGRSVGQELDLILNFHLSPRQDILAAWGHLTEGRFLRTVANGTNSESFWLMYTFRW